MTRLFRRVAILGTGLIGGSVALGVKERGLAEHLALYDAVSAHAEYLQPDSVHTQPEDAVKDADLVILAAPPQALVGLAERIAPHLAADACITDVASVKRQAMRDLAWLGAGYVPAHPIAGSEKTGPEAARADLFAGRRVILTPDEAALQSQPVARVKTFWEALGAGITFMPGFLHDRIYAYVSHLPQMVAFAASGLPEAQTGEPRFTRLMHSDRTLWSGILLANADYAAESLGAFLTFAAQMAGELAEAPEDTKPSATGANLLPPVAATCLIAAASGLEDELDIALRDFAGSGFADMTAAASGDPQGALEAISASPHEVSRGLTALMARCQPMLRALQTEDKILLDAALAG